MERTPHRLPIDQPRSGCSDDPPDAAGGGYASYVERLEGQIAAHAKDNGPHPEEGSAPAPESEAP